VDEFAILERDGFPWLDRLGTDEARLSSHGSSPNAKRARDPGSPSRRGSETLVPACRDGFRPDDASRSILNRKGHASAVALQLSDSSRGSGTCQAGGWMIADRRAYHRRESGRPRARGERACVGPAPGGEDDPRRGASARRAGMKASNRSAIQWTAATSRRFAL
jgi:hypothetical protein